MLPFSPPGAIGALHDNAGSGVTLAAPPDAGRPEGMGGTTGAVCRRSAAAPGRRGTSAGTEPLRRGAPPAAEPEPGRVSGIGGTTGPAAARTEPAAPDAGPGDDGRASGMGDANELDGPDGRACGIGPAEDGRACGIDG
ncbi:hypothetical protein JHN46_29035, partial [Streptomyces sp. MBT33]|nr:hypothetical protein [Streptomyces sp. MBT33]